MKWLCAKCLPRKASDRRPCRLCRGWGDVVIPYYGEPDDGHVPSRLARCAHPTCRTSLAEDAAVQCPHGLTFCDGCTWEEACGECAPAAIILRVAS